MQKYCHLYKELCTKKGYCSTEKGCGAGGKVTALSRIRMKKFLEENKEKEHRINYFRKYGRFFKSHEK